MQTQNNLLKFSGKMVMVLSLFLMSMTACKKDKTEITDQEYRTIAWNYLNATQKATVNTNWETAPVLRPSAENPESVSVRFGTTQDALLGPIMVYISIQDKTKIGIGGRF
ncbi:hypothetical protein [Pedobacter sp. Hv1]|uniref:hypothetical protein n=1 Tax=Pedobacter sp. Hv1 TaxID=1740090 RepID=UPI0006D8B78A|nr:hypothetical protein [Pedobacter sp. Hv1]KQC00280.1 hypothetical protein AQF98_12360 [Pedobacter sp. Hv1]